MSADVTSADTAPFLTPEMLNTEIKAVQQAKGVDDVTKTTLFGLYRDSLLLQLRCFIGSVDDRLPAISDLHVSIDRKFRDAEIAIAFPQRDVHIDTTRPLEIRVSHEKYQAGAIRDANGSDE